MCVKFGELYYCVVVILLCTQCRMYFGLVLCKCILCFAPLYVYFGIAQSVCVILHAK
jgi:hypothetical protein